MKEDFRTSKYYRVGRATDLEGSDYRLYRFLEMVPGLVAWSSLILLVFLSYFFPFYCAIFVLLFVFYWLLRTIYFAIYLHNGWQKVKDNKKVNWTERLAHFKYNHIYQMVILPFYNEDAVIIRKSLDALLDADWNHKRMIVVLAGEERAKEDTKNVVREIEKEYAKKFGHLIYTIHPANLPNEIPGKGSNIAYAAEQARLEVLDKNNLPYEEVLVSAFDIDTVVFPEYFLCLTWNFLVSEHPYRTSFQPIPVFNNNIWDTPAISRIMANSATFWQLIQQERPETMETFSSHSVCFKTLYEVGYWQKNIVSEDSRIFWGSFLVFNGEYYVTPIYYPVSMDGNLAHSAWQTAINVYKQQRRWAWGAENFAYVVFGLIKNKNFSNFTRWAVSLRMIEGLWSWSTNSIIIFVSGWLLIFLGGADYSATIISYNLPLITRNMMIVSMVGLILSMVVSMNLLPEQPEEHKKKFTKVFMILQWVLVPICVIIFGTIPALESQTRLMFGKYMGFWVTPKHRVNTK